MRVFSEDILNDCERFLVGQPRLFDKMCTFANF